MSTPRKRTCPPEYKGTRVYVSTMPFYRLGRTYQPGERITLVDTIPNQWMTLVEDATPAPAPAPQAAPAAPTAKGGRPSDRQV